VYEKKSEIQQGEYFPEDRVLAREQAIASKVLQGEQTEHFYFSVLVEEI
jgi:hypothetical protein